MFQLSEEIGTSGNCSLNRITRDEDYLQNFKESILEKNFIAAKRVFSRYCNEKFPQPWQKLSLELKLDFLQQCHHFINGYILNASQGDSRVKAFKTGHQLYCQLIKYCVVHLDTQEQASFYQAGSDFYLRHVNYPIAVAFYGRALSLLNNQNANSSLARPRLQQLETAISRIDFTWRQDNGEVLDAAMWKTYWALLEAVQAPLENDELIQSQIGQLQCVADNLIVSNAWQLVHQLYRKATTSIEHYQTQLKRELNAVLCLQEDDMDTSVLEAFYRNSRKIEVFAQRLAQHRQWAAAITSYELLLHALSTNPPPGFDTVQKEALESKLFELTKHQEAYGYRDKILLSVPTSYRPAWLSYHTRLNALRKIFKSGLESQQSIFELQADYCKGIQSLMNQLIADSVQIAGTAPTAFCVVAGGSLGRLEMAPYSDLEIALLIQEEIKEEWHHAYWQRLINIIQFYLRALGEPWSIEKESCIQSVGIAIDEDNIPYLKGKESLFIQRPSKLAAWVIHQLERSLQSEGWQREGKNAEYFILAYGLLRVLPLYSYGTATAGDPLCQEYERSLAVHLDLKGEHTISSSCTKFQQLGTAILKANNASVFTRAAQLIRLQNLNIDLKDSYLKPLLFWCLDISLLAGNHLPQTHTLIPDLATILKALLHSQRFHPQWLAAVQETLAWVETLRCRLQLKRPGRPDDVARFKNAQSISTLSLSSAEHIYIEETTRCILKPAFWSIDLFLRATVLGFDPPIALWEEAIAKWYALNKEQRQEATMELYASLEILLYHLAYRKSPVSAYYQAFNQFRAYSLHPELTLDDAHAFRIRFIEILKSFSKSPQLSLDVKAIRRCLSTYPEPNGYRPIFKYEARKWKREVDSLFVELDSPLLDQSGHPALYVTRCVQERQDQHRYITSRRMALHPNLLRGLLQQKKIIPYGTSYRFVPKRNQPNPGLGRHNVIDINLPEGSGIAKVHLKLYPEMPGMEWAAGALTRRLIGWGAPNIALTRFHLADGDCPILISQTVTGENLRALLKNNIPVVLNHKEYSQRSLVSNILNQEDGKSANYIASPCQWGIKLFCVDNDRTFYPAVITDSAGEIIPVVKDIIYCFPECRGKIHPEARDEFLALDAHEVLASWLLELQAASTEIGKLFFPHDMKKFFPTQSSNEMIKGVVKGLLRQLPESPTTSILPVPVREGLASELYHKISSMQDYLLNHSELTHIALLHRIERLLARYYSKFLEHELYSTLSVKDRFKVAFGRYYGIKEKEMKKEIKEKDEPEETTQSSNWESLQTLYGIPTGVETLLACQDRYGKEALHELSMTHRARAKLRTIKQGLLQCQEISLAEFASLPIPKLRTEIINAVDFNFNDLHSESGEDDKIIMSYQEKIVQVLIATQTPFTLLKLAHCRALSNTLFYKLLKCSPHLHSIDISGCINLSFKALQQLARYPTLKKIKANGLTQLTVFNFRQSLGSSKAWQGLEYLELGDCINLLTLHLQIPTLTCLKISGAKKLIWDRGVSPPSPKVEATALRQLYLDNTPNPFYKNEEDFFAFLQPHSELKYIKMPSIYIGSVDKMQWLSTHGASFIRRDNYGNTALLLAAYSGDLEIVKWLQSQGALLTERNNNGDTALLLATYNGHLEVVKWLQGQGAGLAEENIAGNTALLLAAHSGHLEIVKWLQRQGALLTDRNNNGDTALLLAAHSGHLEIVKWLQRQGALLADRNNNGETALLLAAHNGHLEVLKWLQRQGASLNERNNAGDTALLLAAYNGHLKVVTWLQSCGISFAKKNNAGNTALLLAATNGHLQVVKRLLSHGTLRIDKNEYENLELLHRAGPYGGLEVVKWLPSQIASLSERNNAGDTALLLAAHNGRIELIKWLLSQGASLSERNLTRDTPLLLAASSGRLETVQWLLDHGATLVEKDNGGHTALLLAASNGNLETVQWLLGHGASLTERSNAGHTALLLAASNGKLETVQWLLGHGATLAEKSNDGYTALLLAASNGKLETVQWLLGHGATLADKSNDGCTALLLAASNGKLETLQWLCNQGASLSETNTNGDTALHLAALNGEFGTVVWLSSVYTSLTKLNTVSNTLLHLAAYNGQLGTVKWLLNYGASLGEKNTDGSTTLLLAAQNGQLKTVKWLLSHGASLNEKSADGSTALLLAAQNGQLKTVQWLLNNGASLADRNNGGNTALLTAAYNGQLETVKWLLNHGATLIERNNNSDTALLLAAYNGHLRTVQWLLDNGASLSEKSADGTTALLLAAYNGQLKTVQWLLSHGASLADKSKDGSSALLLAAYNGQLGTVQWLLNYEELLLEKSEYDDTLLLPVVNQTPPKIAQSLSSYCIFFSKNKSSHYKIKLLPIGAANNVKPKTAEKQINSCLLLSQKNNDGETALMRAARNGQLSIIRWFFYHGATLAEKNNEGNTALLLAAFAGHLKTVKWLLKYGVSLAEKDNNGNTALLLAASNGKLETVEWLLNHGASIGEKNNNDDVALFLAAQNGQLETVKWLLKYGTAKVNKDKNGNTLLLLAAYNGRLGMIKWLLAQGASLAEKDNNGSTSLLLAVSNGQLEVVKWLLGQGASLAEKNNDGSTPLLLAICNGQLEAVMWLLKQGASLAEKDNNGNTPLLLAASNGQLEAVRWLLSQGVSLTERDNNGNTALLLAASNGQLDVVKWLLIQGASLAERDNNGNTALLLAASNGQLEAVRWLLRQGASLAEKDRNGNTPLLLAVSNGQLEVVKWLLIQGASLSEKNYNDSTSLLLAAYNGQLGIVKWVIKHGASLTERDNKGNTALLLAAYNGQLETLKWLSYHGASQSDINNDDNTALLLAGINGQRETVKWLIDSGALLTQRRMFIGI